MDTIIIMWVVGTNTLYFASSKDNGNTFGKIVNLSYSSTGRSSSPQIVTSGNNVYVIWQGDTTNSSDIYFASSKDNGNTFGKIVNLSYSSTGRSFSPQIVLHLEMMCM